MLMIPATRRRLKHYKMMQIMPYGLTCTKLISGHVSCLSHHHHHHISTQQRNSVIGTLFSWCVMFRKGIPRPSNIPWDFDVKERSSWRRSKVKANNRKQLDEILDMATAQAAEVIGCASLERRGNAYDTCKPEEGFHENTTSLGAAFCPLIWSVTAMWAQGGSVAKGPTEATTVEGAAPTIKWPSHRISHLIPEQVPASPRLCQFVLQQKSPSSLFPLLHHHLSTDSSAASDGFMDAADLSRPRLLGVVPGAGWVGGGTPPDHLRGAPHALARRGSGAAEPAITAMLLGGGGGGWRGTSLRRAPPASRADPKQGVQEQMSINEAATDWGLKCFCYEIRDISPPVRVKKSMEMQEDAERRKRAHILQSEGEAEAILARSQATAEGIRMVSESTSAEGSTEMSLNEAATDWRLKFLCYEKAMEMQAEAERRKRAQILESEGAMLDEANGAKGEGEAILARSQAIAEGIRMVSESMSAEAVNLRVAELKTLKALEAKNMTTMNLPSDAGNPSATIAQSLSIYQHIFKSKSSGLKEGSHEVEEAEEADQDQPSVTSGMPPLGDDGSTSTLRCASSKPFFGPSFLFPNDDGVR